MDRHFLSLALAGTAIFVTQNVIAQEETPKIEEEKLHTFEVSAQLRPRFEYRNGAYLPLSKGDEPAILVNNRTRLNFDYASTGNYPLGVHLSLQNVNIWGQAPQIQVTDKTGGLSVFEAYAVFPLADKFSAKVGRQMIALDDDRIFGSLDWHPAGRSHDALNINWNPNENLQIRSFFAFNQNYLDGTRVININSPKGQHFVSSNAQPYQHMETLHAHYAFSKATQLSFLFSNLGFRNDTAQKTYDMQTFGVHYIGAAADWKYGFSGYVQTGKNVNGITKGAYLLAVNAGYKFSPAFSLNAGLDYLSGNDNSGTSTTDKAFNPFSGTNHKFYGFMDYYYVSFSPSVGLINPYLSANVRINEKSNLSATYHHFSSAGKIADANSNQRRSLGNEIDLVYNLKVQPFVSIQVGYSTYFSNKHLEALKGVTQARGYQDWLWCSLNINPKLFSAKF